MPRFFFDVFDDSQVLIDDYGETFPETEDAAGQAVSILTGFARDLLPGDGTKSFGVAVREGEADVYRAALVFRDAYPGPSRSRASPGDGAMLSVPDPTDVIRQSREIRAQAAEIHERLGAATADLRQTVQRLEADCRDRSREGTARLSPGGSQRAA